MFSPCEYCYTEDHMDAGQLLDRLEQLATERDAKIAQLLRERRHIIEEALHTYDVKRAEELSAQLRGM